MSGPLSKVKVLDMSRYIAGPFCSMLLGDMGADVIKVEKRSVGEDSRELLPFVDNNPNKVSLYYAQYNKNKRSITVDFRNPKGIELIKKLIKKVDVLVENFRPGTLEKMGLSKEVLQEINPGLIVSSISGFGQDGPYKDRAAFDCIGQAMGGLMGVTGMQEGEPLLTGTWIGDFTTGLYSAFGIVAALYHKEKTGEGQFLDLSLVECVTSLLATAVPLYASTGEIQKRRGNRDSVTGPANAFKTNDGWIYLHAGTDPLFKRLTKLMGMTELNEDQRFKTVGERMKNIEEIESIVQEWIKQYDTAKAEERLNAAGIPAGTISTVKDIFNNPQLKHREAFVKMNYPGSDEITVSGITVKMSKTPGKVRRRPPMLGEHNYEVYGEMLGLNNEEIDELLNKEII